MVTRIETEEVRRRCRDGAQLVEVLPQDEYDLEHLPGAVSVPLVELDDQRAATLDPTKPVIVYCFDYQCDLSARAARRFESLGFSEVLDYTAGKAAWLAEGLPGQGSRSDSERAGAAARSVPYCRPDDTVSVVASDLAHPPGLVVVTDDDNIVLGLLRSEVADLPPETRVADAMQPGPVTVRPSITRRELAESMESQGEDHVLVSTLQGELVGLVTYEDLGGPH
jgi:rhodanese-related sulfurtransferase/CBS domain-containing protein